MIKSLKKHIASILIINVLVICFLQQLSCSAIEKSNQDSVRKIYLTFNMPVVNLAGELTNVHDSLCIYYYNNYILYQLPNHYSQEEEGKIILREIQYNYFVYKKGDRDGSVFSSLKDSVGKKVKVDSVLAAEAFSTAIFYNNKNDSLIKTIQDISANTIVKMYVPKFKYDDTYGDTLYLYFTKKLKNINYSFSKELDSSMNFKLYKVRLLYNPRYSTTYKIMAPKREFKFEINELPVDNAVEIKYFFRRLKY